MSDDQRGTDIKKFDKKIQDWVKEIDKLKERASQAKGEMKAELQTHIAELREKEKAARETLRKAVSAGEDAWKELKQGVEKSFSELNNSIQKAREKLKQKQ